MILHRKYYNAIHYIRHSGFIVFLFATIVSCSCTFAQNSEWPVSNKALKIRVLTYNIHHCNPPSSLGVIDPEAIARVIRQQQPDLVALQEVDNRTQRSNGIDQASELARITGLHSHFAKAIDFMGGEYGVAVLSKYPIISAEVIKLPNDPVINAEPRVFLLVGLKINEEKVLHFGCTHLDVKDEQNRTSQAEFINQIASKLKSPLIVAGDLNAIPDSRPLKILEQQFVRTCDPCDYTIPSDTPRKTIDFILFTKESPLQVVSTSVIHEQYASDHMPVLSVLEWMK